ncbi:hypothetical protein FRC09_013986 [Ceratobasidium sp. 395]|nr:hypothetical protein FRC09_013986 [Ceratobasidium sp. 395]
MSPPSIWLRCHYCRNTFKGEHGLEKHLIYKDKCRARHERRMAARPETPHHHVASSTLQSQTPLPPDPNPNENTAPHTEDATFADSIVELELPQPDSRDDTSVAGESTSEAPSNSIPDQPAPRKKHGYATIETHPNAARVLRWEAPRVFAILDNPLEQPSSFETGEWLCELPISNADRDRYFMIERHKKGILFENTTQLYWHVDALPHGPDWSHRNMKVSTREGSETFDLWKRSSLEAVEALIGDVNFDGKIRYAPEQHFRITPDGRRVRVWSEACTGDWWWRTQDKLGPNATIASVLLATDETHLSLICGNRKAWPVYITIANIDKDVRKCTSERAMLLIGYIPAPDLAFITNPEERRQKKWEVYHAALNEILAPLRRASSTGIEMVCADGGVRRVYPIVAGHMADFKEQCLAACVRESRCPICEVPSNIRGDGQGDAKLRTRLQTLEAWRHARRGYTFTQQNLGLRPTRPYWANLPFATGHMSFVPDALHQMHQGVFKDHMLARWRRLIGNDTVDKRLMGMPRFPGIRHFKEGISHFFTAQWTGTESREAAKVFLPMVAGTQPTNAVGAARCVMDFAYRAHLPQLDDDDLDAMESDLAEFHDLKDIFISEGALQTEQGWHGIPKIHMLSHYVQLIREYGTIDGYSTDISERLHIDYVKVPYRASNKVDPIEQMITLLQRQEAWAMQRKRLEDRGLIAKREPRSRATREDKDEAEKPEVFEDEGDNDEEETDNVDMEEMGNTDKQCHNPDAKLHPDPTIRLAKRPSKPSVTGQEIMLAHRAPGFLDAAKRYVSSLPGGEEHGQLLDDDFYFGVWTKFTLVHKPLPFAPLVGPKNDLVRARPARISQRIARQRPSVFDTVLVEHDPEAHGMRRYCAARVRVIFRLPRFCHELTSEPLAYVELFNQLTSPTITPHRLFQTSHRVRDLKRITRVVPLSDIRMACHLVPQLDPYTRHCIQIFGYRAEASSPSSLSTLQMQTAPASPYLTTSGQVSPAISSPLVPPSPASIGGISPHSTGGGLSAHSPTGLPSPSSPGGFAARFGKKKRQLSKDLLRRGPVSCEDLRIHVGGTDGGDGDGEVIYTDDPAASYADYEATTSTVAETEQEPRASARSELECTTTATFVADAPAAEVKSWDHERVFVSAESEAAEYAWDECRFGFIAPGKVPPRTSTMGLTP